MLGRLSVFMKVRISHMHTQIWTQVLTTRTPKITALIVIQWCEHKLQEGRKRNTTTTNDLNEQGAGISTPPDLHSTGHLDRWTRTFFSWGFLRTNRTFPFVQKIFISVCSTEVLLGITQMAGRVHMSLLKQEKVIQSRGLNQIHV